MPPDAMTPPRSRRTSRSRSARSGPPRRPSRSIAVTSNDCDPDVGQAADQLVRRRPLGSVLPCVTDGLAVADIDRDRDAIRAGRGD